MKAVLGKECTGRGEHKGKVGGMFSTNTVREKQHGAGFLSQIESASGEPVCSLAE